MNHKAKVSDLAYQIWESEGRPQGESKRHWEMACELAETEIDGYIEPVTKLSPLDPIEQLEPEDSPL